MATLEELVVSLTAETAGLRAELNQATKTVQQSTDKMDKAVSEFSKNSSKNTSFFQTAMGTMAGFLASQVVLGAFGMVKDAAAFLGDQLLKGAAAANAEELALTKLANSLALSGQYSAAAMKDLQAFTGEMEQLTNIGDDVVASNLAILSSLTKLDAEGLKQAQRAAIDLSTAVGIDLESATRMVAKGINGNTDAFQRQGIEIENATTKTERLKNIMEGLSGVTGSAAGATKTFAGSLGGIENSWGNLFESVAKAVTQNEAVVAVLGVVKNTLDALTSSVDGNNQSFKDLVAVGMIMFLESLAAIAVATDALLRVTEATIQGIMTAWHGASGALASVVGIFSDSAKQDAEEIFQAMDESARKTGEAFSRDTFLGDAATKLFEMRDAAEEAFVTMGQNAEEAVAPTVKVSEAVRELSAEQTKFNELIAQQAQALADQGASLDGQYQYQLALLKGHLEAKAITEQEYFDAQNALMLERQAQEQAQLDQAYANKAISDQQYSDANIALARKNSLESQKAANDLVKAEDTANKTRAANLHSTLGTIATLSQSSNKQLAAIGKAAAISQATIDGYAAVQKALASAPPPFNFALAAAVGAATAANVAKIAGVGFNKGIDSVPGVGNRDTVPAMLTPGERVVPQQTNQDLTEFLAAARSGGMGSPSGQLEIVLSFKDGFMDMIETQLIERGRLGLSLQGA